MADVTLTYKGATIAELSESGSKTLRTAGKYCEADIGVEYVKPSGGGNEDAIISHSLSGSYTNSSVSAVGSYAFYYCKQLTSVTFSAATTVGYGGFCGCSNLASVHLPLVTEMENDVFRNCFALESVDIPNLSYIRSNVFRETKIPAAFWPGKTAGLSSFQDCKSLVTAVVGSTVYTGTFNGCSALTAADLTNATGSIVASCFSGDALLSTLVIRGTNIFNLVNINAFDGTPFASGGSGGTIYIPKSLYDHLSDGTSLDYKAATNWSTMDGYGTITWAAIEGSIYETQYADGTPII